MKKIAFLILINFVLTGCAMGKVYYDYGVVIKNLGEIELKDVSVTSKKGLWHETGYVVKGAHAGIGGPQSTPPNDIYTIISEREDGTRSQSTVDLRNRVEKNFKGRITFTINDNNEVGYELMEYKD